MGDHDGGQLGRHPADRHPSPSGRAQGWPGSLRPSLLVSGVLLALAVGAVLFPRRQASPTEGIFLVFDSSGDPQRATHVFEPLRRYLVEVSGIPLGLRLVAGLPEFRAELGRHPSFVLCPDGVALGLPDETLLPLAVGRRPAPRNLRPRAALVYRLSAGLIAEPWRNRPEATIVGDSLSLSATGSWRRPDAQAPPGATVARLAFGPDPYDHGPALQAARMGCFDYALVRQWDAERFFSGGLLAPGEWGMELLTPPVPDITLFVARGIPPALRLVMGDDLSGLGRSQERTSPAALEAQAALARLRLVGFNVLIEADFDLVRHNFPGDWPRGFE